MSVKEMLLKLIIASICGLIIGFERKRKSKEAGMKTHLIVCIASTLVMLVSKYGFSDINNIQDPARIGAQVISGVGFLGAGLIFVKNDNVSGLTTAAGIWATAGIGLAIGVGMIDLALFSTFIIVAANQMLYIYDSRHRKEMLSIHCLIILSKGDLSTILNELHHIEGMTIQSYKVYTNENRYELDCQLHFDNINAKKQWNSYIVSKMENQQFTVVNEITL